MDKNNQTFNVWSFLFTKAENKNHVIFIIKKTFFNKYFLHYQNKRFITQQVY